MYLRAVILVLTLLLWALPAPVAHAQEDTQYRRIELVDGTILYGQIVTSDAESLTVRAQKGDVIVPWMDVLDMTELSPAEYEEKVTVRLAYVGTQASTPELRPVAEAVGARFQDALAEAPRINLLRTPTLISTLAPAQQAQLKACTLPDAQCVGDATHSARLAGYLYGTVEPIGEQVRATFSWVNLDDTTQTRDITVPFKAGSLPAQSSLITAVWHLLELDDSTKPQLDSGDTSAGNASADVWGSGAERSSRAQGGGKSATQSAEVRGQLTPLPGAPALFMGEKTPFVVSLGVTGLLTASAVYVVGGVGLNVPWDADQAAWADPVFLTGVGVVSYVAITLVTNQVVARTLKPRTEARLSVSPAPGGLSLRF